MYGKTRLLIIIVFLALVVIGVRMSDKHLEFVANFAKNFTTRLEVETIARSIYLNFTVAGQRRGIPDKTDNGWSDYIRETIKTKDPRRDPALDQWSKPYIVRATHDMPASDYAGFTVTSAGPDSLFDTDDDIVALRKYR
jgi:hypothetical protein